MFTVRKFAAVGAAALFIGLMGYVGFINEQLKVALAPWHRVIFIIGFIIGAGTVCRYLINVADRRLQK